MIDYSGKMRFREGQEVWGLTWPDESTLQVGMGSCIRITVVMQQGQMSMVPWFMTEHTNGQKYLHNGTDISNVMLTPRASAILNDKEISHDK